MRPETSLLRNETSGTVSFFDRIVDCARQSTPLSTAVCWPCSTIALAGAIEAADLGIIRPIFVGPPDSLQSLGSSIGADLSRFEIVESEDEAEAAATAVDLCRAGETGAIMKGSLHTDVFMHAVLKKESGLNGRRRMSHVFVIDCPGYGRPLLVSDAAINISPTLSQKAAIVQNAIDLACALGIRDPRVAVLSAVEVVDPAIASSVEAAILCKMADRSQIRGGIVDGPLAFDTAVSLRAAETKGLKSPVAGRADILIVPDLDAGNMLAKELEYMTGARIAGIAVGAVVPVILTSRADTSEARILSCAVASIFASSCHCDA